MSKWITEAEDAEVNRILALSHNDLLAEIAARGEDPAEILAEVNRIYDAAKAEAYQRKTNRGYAKDQKNCRYGYVLPDRCPCGYYGNCDGVCT